MHAPNQNDDTVSNEHQKKLMMRKRKDNKYN